MASGGDAADIRQVQLISDGRRQPDGDDIRRPEPTYQTDGDDISDGRRRNQTNVELTSDGWTCCQARPLVVRT